MKDVCKWSRLRSRKGVQRSIDVCRMVKDVVLSNVLEVL
jgi:hypothetical protein